MDLETSQSSEVGAPAGGGPVLIIWSGTDPALRSTGSTLAGLLGAEPHRLPVVAADLVELLGGRSLLQSLAARVAERLEAAVLASQGWQAVEPLVRGQLPRLVVALDPAAAAAVNAWRARGQLGAALVGVCCGLRLDPAWARTPLERLSVADPVQAEAALGLGLPAETLVPCGIPVCGGFAAAASEERQALRRRFGLAPERPVVLVVTHGLGEEVLTGALFQLSMVAERATLLFDVARDEEGAELLRRRVGLYGISAQMFGKVEEGGQLWACADLVIARPHTYVEQRALALRLPLVAVQARGPEERETAGVWSARGLGRQVEHVSTLAAEVDLQLAPAALQGARERMASVSRRSAASELARFIAQARAQSEQLLEETARRSAAMAVEPAPPPRRGPLEPIGVTPAQARPLEAAERLADLEAAESEANRQVSEHQRELERWAHRAELAAQKGEPDLRAYAEQEAQRHQAAMHRALAELARVAERRQGLEQARPVVSADRAFRKLEIEEALEALKRKLQ